MASSSSRLRRASWLVAGLALLFVVVWRSPPANLFSGLASYLPLHTVLETFSVAVAVLIFGLGWHAHSREKPGNLLLLACVFLAVALIDVAHFLSYAGMPDFVTPSSPQKAIDFWLAARLAAALGLLATAVLPWRPYRLPGIKYWLLAASLGLSGGVYWLVLFHQDMVPPTFIPGKGLTAFKIGFEYVLIAIHAVTAFAFSYKLRGRQQPFDVVTLLAAACVMMLSELCFTLYSDVTDAFNLLGHIYKVIAYGLLYKAIFADSVRAPFLRLYEAERAAWKEKERAEVTLHSIGDAVITTDAAGRVEYLNPIAEALTGWRDGEAAGRPLSEVFRIINEYSREPAENPIEKCLREGVVVALANHTALIRRDGHEVAIEDSAAPIRSREGSILGGVMVFHDVSERRTLQDQARRLASVIEATPGFVGIVDADLQGVYLNPAGRRLVGIGQDESVVRVGLLDRIYPEWAKKIVVEEGIPAALTHRVWQGETALLSGDGRQIPTSQILIAQRDAEGNLAGFATIIHDISERKDFELQLYHLAHHDALTGLPNRILIHDRLGQALVWARRTSRLVGVLFLDLDRFKTINDTLGHDLGDKLLDAVARRLVSCVRESDSVGRLGGDEFMIILPNLAQAQDCTAVCEAVLSTLAQPLRLEGHEQDLYITCSIGVSLFPNDGDDEQTLVRNADTAMYRAKEQGRNTYQYYTNDMNARAFERLALENSLRKALEREEMQVYYQPKIDATSGEVIGAEALVRWQHPEMGMVMPARFIPVAEESGLIIPIGEYVLRAACAQARQWMEMGFGEFSVAVNLSARQFRESHLVEMVRDALKETGLDPSSLQLELTESLLMQNSQTPVLLLKELKQLGIQISIDDFGTGFSSLNYLKRFPIDELKIDRSFIMDVTTNANDAAIVRAICAMAQSLRLQVVAEGVEQEEQVAFLHNAGCNHMQGYYYSQPLPVEEFTSLLRSGKKWPRCTSE